MVLTWSWRTPWIWNSRVNSEVKKWKRKKILCKEMSAIHTQADILPTHPVLSSKMLLLSSSIFRCPTHALMSRNTILLSNVARRSAVLLSVQYCSVQCHGVNRPLGDASGKFGASTRFTGTILSTPASNIFFPSFLSCWVSITVKTEVGYFPLLVP